MQWPKHHSVSNHAEYFPPMYSREEKAVFRQAVSRVQLFNQPQPPSPKTCIARSLRRRYLCRPFPPVVAGKAFVSGSRTRSPASCPPGTASARRGKGGAGARKTVRGSSRRWHRRSSWVDGDPCLEERGRFSSACNGLVLVPLNHTFVQVFRVREPDGPGLSNRGGFYPVLFDISSEFSW